MTAINFGFFVQTLFFSPKKRPQNFITNKSFGEKQGLEHEIKRLVMLGESNGRATDIRLRRLQPVFDDLQDTDGLLRYG